MEDKQLCEMDSDNRFPSLRTHLFSFPMDSEHRVENMKNFQFLEGRSETLARSNEFMKKFIAGESSRGCLILSGEMGIGKSLLLRKLIYAT